MPHRRLQDRFLPFSVDDATLRAYLHGPGLQKEPWFADYLLCRALAHRHQDASPLPR